MVKRLVLEQPLLVVLERAQVLLEQELVQVQAQQELVQRQRVRVQLRVLVQRRLQQ
jgi:hypothetical protein